MKRGLVKFLIPAVMGLLSTRIQAQQISGAIEFNGYAALNSSIGSATAVVGYAALLLGPATGSFSSMTNGYVGLAFNTFIFGGNGGTTLTLVQYPYPGWLWQVSDESLNLWQLFPSSAITVTENSSSLYITGTGLIEENGGNSTSAAWTFSANTAAGTITTFEASTVAIPEPGTIALVGIGVLTLLAFSHRHK
jgi:hypothetical protein